MIYSKTRILTTLGAIVLALCLFSGQSTSARSTNRNCRQVSGKLTDVFNGNGTTGRITHGGILNGTTQVIFTNGFLPTSDPTTFSFTGDFTVTTNHGQLKASNVGILDVGRVLIYDNVFTEIGIINPTTSTGRFAGATGVLFTSGKSSDGGFTFKSKITGEICLAHDRDSYSDSDEDEDDN